MKNVDNQFDLPRDVIHSECLMELTGRKEILVENYKTILKISTCKIEILCKKYIFNVIGKNLNIKYYNKDSMIIGGIINEISFFNNNN